jgi:3-deoxy-D-manno-octulosonate 8-phosphate phosphatase (KDO 8-P phosphatase)
VSPANGARGLRRQADWVLRSRGGDGALRELTEALLASQGLLRELHHNGWREGNG